MIEWTPRQKVEVRKSIIDAIKKVEKYKGRRYETVSISLQTRKRTPVIVTAKEDKDSFVESMYRDALITTWETSLRVVFNNIKYMKGVFKMDNEIISALNKIEKFFRKKK